MTIEEEKSKFESSADIIVDTKERLLTKLRDRRLPIDSTTTFRQYADVINNWSANTGEPSFQEKEVVPDGSSMTIIADEEYDGLSKVIIKGDPNLIPENIAEDISIYGVTGKAPVGCSNVLRDSYDTYKEHADELYMRNLGATPPDDFMILESNGDITIGYFHPGFEITAYTSGGEEHSNFSAINWIRISYHKEEDDWSFDDFRTEASAGWNYLKNIRYSTVKPIYYNNVEVWPNGIFTVVGYLPNNIYGIAAAAFGDKVYLFGGRNYPEVDSIKYRKSIMMFDIPTKRLTTIDTELPYGCSNMAAATVNDKIYLFGGYSGEQTTNSRRIYKTSVLVFDPINNTIEQTKSNTESICQINSASVEGGKICIVGAGDSTYDNDRRIYVYDPQTDYMTMTVIDESSSKTPVMEYSVINYKDDIYIFGDTRKYYRFDMDTNSVYTINDQDCKIFAAAFIIEDVIYSLDRDIDPIYTFELSSNTNDKLIDHMPMYLEHPMLAVVGNKAYTFGNYDFGVMPKCTAIYEFDPSKSIG